MKRMKAYPKKTRFAVWGYGVTGRSLADVLNRRGYQVTVIEDRLEEDFPDFADEIKRLREGGVEFHFGGKSNLGDFIPKVTDVLAPSPGIRIPEELVEICDEAKVQIAGEIEVASRVVAGKVVAVTGTDGKTTTTTLIHHILTNAGIPAHVAGNIGAPFIDLAGKTKPDHWLIVEVSSYQLESVRLFRPYIAVLLNIAEDHLERHGDFRTYIRMKGRVFSRQRREDHAVINYDDPSCLQAYGQAVSEMHGLSLAGPIPDGAWRENGSLMVSGRKNPLKIVDIEDLLVFGEHNQYNMLAALLVCSLIGMKEDKIRDGAVTFESLPHRIEKIGTVNDALWVNDSKATNIHSTMSALECFDEPVILLLGGYEKGLDITYLIPYISRRTRHVVLLGETRNRFRKELRAAGYTNITVRKTLYEACTAAHGIAEPGDVVLLSPASSSFDQFRNYIERGDAFRKWVEKKMEKTEP